jgi:endonuclease III
MDAATIARETAIRLRVQHPQARYELDWKTPEQLLVAAVLAGGSRDAAVNDVTNVLFARWPAIRALAKADVAQLTQVIEPLGLAQQHREDMIPTKCFHAEMPRGMRARRCAQPCAAQAFPQSRDNRWPSAPRS